MSSYKHFLVTLAVIAIVLPSVALATEYKVGDNAGWTVGFDYANWAKGKEFRVGDKLVFTYPVGAHNVFKVNGTTFKDCTIPPLNEALISGNDVITLAIPGNKWYFCGVGQHCALGGQKLAITVWPALEAPAPAPSSANGVVASGFLILIASIISFAI
ncbi:Blue copper protein [Thalictrum thalictroides]|uniref:Blue copper protein n=1 Tax=Thalictrum thalictroides TaxID=46969 RepID=A0A7J6WYE9_THATH|nr:Blue copper protein [Thalictrum thalictroides]